MTRWFARLQNAWQRHGTFGFVRLAAYNVYYHTVNYRGVKADPGLPDELDTRYGTQTGGIREIGTLGDVEAALAHGAVRYQPSAAAAVRSEIEALALPPDTFSFIDYGSGKGHVLLVAAEFPFRRILGIEFSRELHEIAVTNIARLPAAMNLSGRVASSHADAREAALPDGNLVCYFYNPFGERVMERVVERLAAHHKSGNRIIAIYVDPNHRGIFDRTGIFRTRKNDKGTLVLDTESV